MKGAKRQMANKGLGLVALTHAPLILLLVFRNNGEREYEKEYVRARSLWRLAICPLPYAGRGRFTAPAWCAAARSTTIIGTCAAPTATGTIRTTGTTTSGFVWRRSHFSPSELRCVSLRRDSRPRRKMAEPVPGRVAVKTAPGK